MRHFAYSVLAACLLFAGLLWLAAKAGLCDDVPGESEYDVTGI